MTTSRSAIVVVPLPEGAALDTHVRRVHGWITAADADEKTLAWFHDHDHGQFVRGIYHGHRHDDHA